MPTAGVPLGIDVIWVVHAPGSPGGGVNEAQALTNSGSSARWMMRMGRTGAFNERGESHRFIISD